MKEGTYVLVGSKFLVLTMKPTRISWDRVQIKHIANVKCNQFFHYRDAKEISFYYFCDARLYAKQKKIHMSSIICKVNEWCLVDCFHCKFRVSIQIHNNCIAKCKMFFVSRFFSLFKIFEQ